MTVTWLTGDALEHVRALPAASVDLVATSPPFLALRNYRNLDGQWGSEPTPAAFLDNLLTLATELRRVLTPHGSIAIELGDTYSGSGGAGGGYDRAGMRAGQPKANGSARAERDVALRKKRTRTPDLGWPMAKSLTGIPTLFAWSLAYGRNLLDPTHEIEPWRIRNLIVWARNNPAPGALGDKVRPATSYITVACVSDRRWFDLDAVRTEPIGINYGRQTSWNTVALKSQNVTNRYRNGEVQHYSNPAGAPPLDHWTDTYDGDLTWLVNTHGSSLAHYAMWPARLAERLILSMCPAEVCRSCGEPRRRIDGGTRYVDAKGREHEPQKWSSGMANDQAKGAHSLKPDGRYSAVRLEGGWSDCGHDDYRPGHVLDPFAGTGTTLAVADIHGRDATGIDLDPHNPGLYERRYAECWRALKPDAGPSPVTEHGTQLDLLADTP